MIKIPFYIFLLLLVHFKVCGQDREIKEIISKAVRDSSDHHCKILFDNFFFSFESDEGLANPKFLSATTELVTGQLGSTANKHLFELLKKYTDDTDDPKKALKWIRALKKEYPIVYGNIHPLILLYEGESLINGGQPDKAYQHFINFQKDNPKSVMAMVYIYRTERDKSLAMIWLSVLKKLHPNHWVVKQLN